MMISIGVFVGGMAFGMFLLVAGLILVSRQDDIDGVCTSCGSCRSPVDYAAGDNVLSMSDFAASARKDPTIGSVD